MLDVETYWTDITAARDEDTPPIYELLYDTRADYGMESLLPEAWDNLAERLADDDELWLKFKRYRNLLNA